MTNKNVENYKNKLLEIQSQLLHQAALQRELKKILEKRNTSK